MKPKIIIILVNLILVHFGCSNKSDTNKYIRIPDSLEIYNPFLDSARLNLKTFNKAYKIYTVVNSSCATCVLDFKKWNRFQQELDSINSNTQIILICIAKDNFEGLRYLFENDKVDSIQLPLFLDKKRAFLNLNKEIAKNIENATILTDKNEMILCEGENPFDNNNHKLKILELVKSKAQ